MDAERELAAAALRAAADSDSGLLLGVVKSLSAGPPLGVVLTLSGSTVNTPPIRYLASYAPTVGDVVVVIRWSSGLLVLGKRA